MDKTVIVGQDGQARYELSADNNIVDLRNHCSCTDTARPYQVDGDVKVCLVCNLPVKD